MDGFVSPPSDGPTPPVDDADGAAAHSPDASALTIAVPAIPAGIGTARRRLDAWLRQHAVTGPLRCDVVLLADEAITNAVEHGHRHLDNGEVLVTVTVDAQRITITVADRGRWRPEQDDVGVTHGWGIPMMQALADQIEIASGDAGTTLTANFSRLG